MNNTTRNNNFTNYQRYCSSENIENRYFQDYINFTITLIVVIAVLVVNSLYINALWKTKENPMSCADKLFFAQALFDILKGWSFAQLDVLDVQS